VVMYRAVNPILQQLEIFDYTSHPIGVGMGQGASAITKLRTGKAGFSLSEGELGRAMTELGPFLGLGFMLFRLILALSLFKWALVEARNREPLALLFVPLASPALFFSILEQPTEQGFMVIGVAFLLAGLKLGKREGAPVPSPNIRRQPMRYSMR